MLTEKDYCDYDTCVALKEWGYNAPQRLLVDYFGVYDEPQYDERIHLYDAQKWLRKEKEIYVSVMPEYNEFSPIKGVKYRLEVAHWKDDEFGYETIEWPEEEHIVMLFDSYEEALLEGVRESIKLLKEEK